jgi:hypothetical protein
MRPAPFRLTDPAFDARDDEREPTGDILAGWHQADLPAIPFGAYLHAFVAALLDCAVPEWPGGVYPVALVYHTALLGRARPDDRVRCALRVLDAVERRVPRDLYAAWYARAHMTLVGESQVRKVL